MATRAQPPGTAILPVLIPREGRARYNLQMQPQRTSLTQLIRHLPLAVRVDYRRRIEVISTRWAERLVGLYGTAGATAVVRQRMIQTTNRHEHFRNLLWMKVYRAIQSRGD